MESILRGIVASNHKEAFKEQLLKMVNTKTLLIIKGLLKRARKLCRAKRYVHEEGLAHIDRVPYF